MNLTDREKLKLYEVVYGRIDPDQVEWSGRRYGQGSGPHGSGGDGHPYPACPVCGGLKDTNGEFIASAVGHQKGCKLEAQLKILRHNSSKRASK